MAAPAKFILGADELDFERAPQRPPRSLALQQASARNSGGGLIGFEVFGGEDVITLSWPGMSSADKDALLNWFATLADGMSNSFTYQTAIEQLYIAAGYVVDGYVATEYPAYNVRFADAALPEITELAPDRYAVSVNLLVES